MVTDPFWAGVLLALAIVVFLIAFLDLTCQYLERRRRTSGYLSGIGRYRSVDEQRRISDRLLAAQGDWTYWEQIYWPWPS